MWLISKRNDIASLGDSLFRLILTLLDRDLARAGAKWRGDGSADEQSGHHGLVEEGDHIECKERVCVRQAKD